MQMIITTNKQWAVTRLLCTPTSVWSSYGSMCWTGT